MSNIISWKTASEIIEILKSEGEMVSGMTVAEAAAALGYVKSAGGVYLKTVLTTVAETVIGATASEVAGAATSTATTTATNLALYETSTGTAAVAGVGSVALPIAATLVAAAGGYLIGNQIYKQNSEFLDNLMFPLYDFITGNDVYSTMKYGTDSIDDAPTVPILFDSVGNTFMPTPMVTRVKSYLESVELEPIIHTASDLQGTEYLVNQTSGEQGFGDSTIITDPNLMISLTAAGVKSAFISIKDGSPYTFCIFYVADHSFYCRTDNASNSTQSYKSTPVWFNNNTEVVHYATVWYTKPCEILVPHITLTDPVKAQHTVTLAVSHSNLEFQNLIYSMMYGGDVTGGLPEGITKYVPGTSPAPLVIPDAPSWAPVVVPRTVPREMPDPVETPDIDPDPEKITPFIPVIQPQPNDVPIKLPVVPITPTFPKLDPTPDTSTAPYPSSNPSADPSQLPEPVPKPVPIPNAIPDPIGTGGNTIPIVPAIPAIASATGLLHVYNPTDEQLNQFGTWLWTTFSGDLIDTLSKLFNNPMDAVIGLHELYCTPTSASFTTIKAGYLDSQVASRLVTSRYVEIKCGALSIPEYWGNYLDYSPYTKAYCYLPFIGIVELNADDIVGHGVEITYRIDSYNGSCIAIITTAKSGSPESVTYQYSGNCSVEVPITSGMKSAMQGALIGAATLAVGAATGGAGGLVAASALGAIKGGASSKNTVQHSGSFGSSYGAMGMKKPFMIIKRPIQKVVPGYNENYGYPSHKKVLISTCTGYLKVIEVDVISSTATEEEKEMIEKQLKSGIFVS